MHLQPVHTGWIEIICGSMFSGKTEELIRRLRRAIIARQTVQCFKPARDDRYATEAIVTHAGLSLESEPVVRAGEILTHLRPDVQVVGIDEAQFFDEEIVAVAEHLADEGKRVICAGLDLDWRAEPFGAMPLLIAKAEYITKTLAICMICGNPANRSYRLTDEESQVLVGSYGHYEPRCRRCYAEGSAARSRQQALRANSSPGLMARGVADVG